MPRTSSEKQPKDMTIRQLALAITALAETMPEHTALLSESVKKLNQLQNLSQILGLLAPGGTAPRTGFEQLWVQSAENAEASPILLELRDMLHQHWGDWPPAIREAEGFPPDDDKTV